MWDQRQIGVIIALLALTITPPAQAEGTAGRAGIRPELHFAGISNYENRNGVSGSHGMAAVTAKLSVYSRARPYDGGLFLDQRFTAGGQTHRSTNIGGYLRYNLARWDVASNLFLSLSPERDSIWLYGARFRYRVIDSHKLGIEAIAPLDDAFMHTLMFGYYGSMADSLSVKFLLGANTHGDLNRAARLEISWQIY